MKKISIFLLASLCVVLTSTSCKKSCDTCKVTLETSGIEVTAPITTKAECDEFKANEGKTITQNGGSVKVAKVACE